VIVEPPTIFGCRAVLGANVRPAVRESYEALFHEVDVPNFFLNLRDNLDVAVPLRSPRRERAIGVIYRPDTEPRFELGF
jgi:erythromycin esterase-like protein